MERDELMHRLEHETEVFRNPDIKAAFAAVDRKDFLHADYESEAYEDYAVPTIAGETVLQPTLMAFMLELLDAHKGDTVLNIGSGSGWSSALLASIVGEEGVVYGVERSAELVKNSLLNLKKYPELVVKISESSSLSDITEHAPYERILSTTSFADEAQVEGLLDVLVVGGIMVVPVNSTLVRYEKVSETEIDKKEFPGFTFSEYQ